MAYVDELVALLGYELDGEDDLRRFKDGLDGVQNRLSSFVKTAATLTAGAAAAFTGFFAVQGPAILNTAGEFEKFTSVLETIEGRSEAARRSMDWIADFGKRTPYELAGVTDAFVKLRAYGIDPIANDTLQVLGDTASAMGKDLGQAVEALADASTGEFERLKEFGITTQTIGDRVAFSWSQNGENLTRTVGKNSEEIRQFILENFGARFAGAMEAQSKGWFGMLSNLSDYWSGFQRKIGEAGYFDRAKEQLDGILSWLDRLDEDGTLDRWAESLSNTYVAVLNAGEWFVRRLWTHFEFLSGVYERNAERVQFWAKLIGGWFAFIVARAFPVFTALTLAALAVEDFLTYLGGGESVIGQFIDWIQSVIPVSDGVAQALAAMAGSVAASLGLAFVTAPLGTTKVLLRVLGGLGGHLFRGLVALAPYLLRGVAVLLGLLSNPIGWAALITAAAAAIVYFFWDEIVHYWGIISEWASGLSAEIGTWWSDVGGLVGVGVKILSALWTGMKAAWQLIWAWGSALAATILDWWTEVGGLKGIGETILKTLWEGLKLAWTSISDWGGALMTTVLTWWDDAGGLRGVGETAFTALWDGYKAIWTNIISWAGGLLDALIFVFTGQDTNFQAEGEALMQDFWDGFEALFMGFIDWVAGIPGRIIDAIGSVNLGNIIDWPEPPGWWKWMMGGETGDEPSDAPPGGATPGPFATTTPTVDAEEIANRIAANLAPIDQDQALSAVVEDRRTDARDQSVTNHVTTHLTQHVAQAAQAPREAARATSAAVSRATTPTRATVGAGQ